MKDITILDARGISEGKVIYSKSFLKIIVILCFKGATGRNGGHMWPLTTLPTQEGMTNMVIIGINLKLMKI